MSEPTYLQGDAIANAITTYAIQEVECNCGHLQEIDTEEEYSHGETKWFGKWVCTECNDVNESEGWY